MEWLVYDDGTDPVKDVIDAFAETTSINVRYFRSDTKVPLSDKRNFLNSKADGQLLCFWDDDDFYQPKRIEESVRALQANPDKMIVGSGVMYCYFGDTGEVWRFGPYGENHSTAAVFVFRKELLETSSFKESEFMAEEKEFLHGFTIPMIQLPPNQSIVVIAHSQNSFDKRGLIDLGETPVARKTKLTLDNLVSNHDIRHFIKHRLEPQLKAYTQGDIVHKPLLLQSLLRTLESRFTKLKREYLKAMNHIRVLEHRLNKLSELNQAVQQAGHVLNAQMTDS